MDFKNKSKKMSVLLLACSLVCLPACKKKHKKDNYVAKKHTVAQNKVNFPLMYESDVDRQDETENLVGLFDNEIETTVNNKPVAKELAQNKVDTEFDWTNESIKDEHSFKTIYFDFDKHAVREDQKQVAVYDAIQLKQLLEEARKDGNEPLISIEGHACHSAGNDEYNLIKSQNRANAVLNVF